MDGRKQPRGASAGWLVVGLAIQVGLLGFAAPLAAQRLPQRQTADWQADLITALMDADLLASAESICERHLQRTDAASDEAARWAIRLSSVRTQRIARQPDWNPRLTPQAKQPLENLLKAYPDHPRRLWLRTQLAIAELATVRHAAVGLAIAPEQPKLQDLGQQAAANCLRELEAVADEVRAQNPAQDRDLLALQQTLGLQRVDALLLRGRLYPPGSDSAIASSTAADAAAREVLSRLPPGTQTHQNMQLLRAESLIAMGQPEDALQVLDTVRRAANGALSPRGLALQARALLARPDLPAAMKLLSTYYGADPPAAPRSVEMDLARLQWLLLASEAADEAKRKALLGEIANWLDAIESRGGDYARRQAESQTLRVVRVQPSGGDTRLIAAEAARQLRAGHARQAGELLTQAATVATDPELSLRYAAQAAAILRSAGRAAQAAEVLTESAQRHADAAAAAAIHLQAAWLVAEAMQREGDGDSTALQSILIATAEQWPASPQRQTAADWLVRIFEAKQRYADAARWTLSNPRPSVETLRRAGDLWQAALRSADDDQVTELLTAALQSFAVTEADASPDAVAARDAQRQRLATLFADPKPLRELAAENSSSTAATPLERLLESLFLFRRHGTRAETLVIEIPPESKAAAGPTIDDAVNRLFRDGEQQPRDRARVGAAILRLLSATAPNAGQSRSDSHAMSKARALAWSGQWAEAAAQFDTMIAARPGHLPTIRTAANSLSESSVDDAKRRAIPYWGKIASGVPLGSEAWHQAKQAAIRLHLAIGERAEAARLCRYIMLTRPPQDAAVKASYEALLAEADA